MLKAHPAVAEWRVTCMAAPVQVEGRLVDGRWFYFRARHDAAAVGLSPAGAEGAVEQTLVPVYGRGGPGVDSLDDGRAYAVRSGIEGAGGLAAQEALDLLGVLLGDIRDHVLAAAAW